MTTSSNGCDSPRSPCRSGTKLLQQRICPHPSNTNSIDDGNVDIYTFTNNNSMMDKLESSNVVSSNHLDGNSRIGFINNNSTVTTSFSAWSALALTPKTHNKRRRRTPGSITSTNTTPCKTTVFLSSGTPNNNSDNCINSNDDDDDIDGSLDNHFGLSDCLNVYTSHPPITGTDVSSRWVAPSPSLTSKALTYDCQSLERSLKRVRLSSSSYRAASAVDGRGGDRINYNGSSAGMRSPGELRLQNDIQHAILNQSWVPVLSNNVNPFRFSNGVDMSFPLLLNNNSDAENSQNTSFVLTHRLNTTTSHCGEVLNKDVIVVLEESWKLPPFTYSIDNCSLRHQNGTSLCEPIESLESTSHKDLGIVSFDHNVVYNKNNATNLVQHERTCDVYVIVGRQSRSDPMSITVQILLKEHETNLDSSSAGGVTVVVRLHFHRLYPHQPPIVQRIEHGLNSSTSTTTPFVSGNQLHHNPSIQKVIPTVLFTNNPEGIKLVDGGSNEGHPNLPVGDSVSCIPDRSRNDLIRLHQWTPLCRLSDIVDMLVEALCKYYCSCAPYSSFQPSTNKGNCDDENCNNSMYKRQILVTSPSFHEQQERDDGGDVNKEYNVASTVYTMGSSGACDSSNNGAATNLTPTMSNTRRQKSYKQMQQQEHRGDYYWSGQNDVDKLPVLPQNDDNFIESCRDHRCNRFESRQSNTNNIKHNEETLSDEMAEDNAAYVPIWGKHDGEADGACSSISVEYNYSGSNISLSSSTSLTNANNGSTNTTTSGLYNKSSSKNGVVDVLLPVQVTFPPGRFNVGYHNTYQSKNTGTVNAVWTNGHYNNNDNDDDTLFTDDCSYVARSEKNRMDPDQQELEYKERYHHYPTFDVTGGGKDQPIVIRQPPPMELSDMSTYGGGRTSIVVDHSSLMFDYSSNNNGDHHCSFAMDHRNYNPYSSIKVESTMESSKFLMNLSPPSLAHRGKTKQEEDIDDDDDIEEDNDANDANLDDDDEESSMELL